MGPDDHERYARPVSGTAPSVGYAHAAFTVLTVRALGLTFSRANVRIPPSTDSKCRSRPDLGADPPLPARVNTASCACSVRRCGIWLVRTMQVLGHVRGCSVEPSHVPFPAAMLPAGGALTGHRMPSHLRNPACAAIFHAFAADSAKASRHAEAATCVHSCAATSRQWASR